MLALHILQLIFLLPVALGLHGPSELGSNSMKTIRGFTFQEISDSFNMKEIEVKSENEDGKTVLFKGKHFQWDIKLTVNKYLFAPYYEFIFPNKTTRKREFQHCHYHGTVIGHEKSFVTLSDCDGYHGSIIFNAKEKYSVHTLENKLEVVIVQEQSPKNYTEMNFQSVAPSLHLEPIVRKEAWHLLPNDTNSISSSKTMMARSSKSEPDLGLETLIMSMSPKAEYDDENEEKVPLARKENEVDEVNATHETHGAINYYDLLLSVNHMEGFASPLQVEHYIADVANMLQYYYIHHDFKRLSFRLSGAHYLAPNAIGQYTGKAATAAPDASPSEEYLNRWESYANEVMKNSDIAFLLTEELSDLPTSLIGLSWHHVDNCESEKMQGYMLVTPTAIHDPFELLNTVTHELGHITGIDDLSETKCGIDNSVMRPSRDTPSDWTDFSTCSLEQLLCTPVAMRQWRYPQKT